MLFVTELKVIVLDILWSASNCTERRREEGRGRRGGRLKIEHSWRDVRDYNDDQ